MAKRLSAAGALTGAEGSDPGFAASRSPWLLSTTPGHPPFFGERLLMA
jgi:hypothetical protein